MFFSSEILALTAITVLLFAAAGVWYSRKENAGLDQYLTARGTTGTPVLAATLTASFLGVFILFTPPEAGVIGGLPAILGYGLGVFSLFGAFALLSPKMKADLPQGSTLTDYAWQRYGKAMYGLTLLITLFYMMVHLVAELTAISQVAYQLAGVPLLYTSLLIGFGTVIYTAYGGLKASMFTDMLQMILIVALLAVIAGGVLYFSGGPGQVMAQVSAQVPELLTLSNRGGLQYGLTLCIAVMVSNLFHQGYWQRIYAGKDTATLKKSLGIAMALALPIMLLAGLFGIVSAGLFPGMNPSVALFTLTEGFFPKGLLLVLFLLALVLVMSTVDTLLNAIVSILTVDGKRLIKGWDERKRLVTARLITIVIMLPLALVSAQGYSVLTLFFIADLVCAGVCFPLFFGFYSKKLNGTTALIASLLGISSGIPFFMAGHLLVSFTLPILISAGVSLIGIKLQKSVIAG